MGRKKAAEGAPKGGEHAGEKPADKVSAVRQALDTGLSSPTEIAAYIAKKYGMEVTTNYVSVIKGQYKQSGGSQKKPAAPQSTPAKASAPVHQPSSAKIGALGSLAPEDLAELADLVDKVGGVHRLEEYLDVIKRMK